MSDTTTNKEYEPGMHPDLPPPAGTVGPIHWIKENLFSSPVNTILTLLTAFIVVRFVPPAIDYLFINAVFDAESQFECREISASGACWAWAVKRINLLVYGFYPAEEHWRINILFVETLVAAAPILFPNLPFRRALIIHAILFPFIAIVLLLGGTFSILGLFDVDTGLRAVPTDKFGGMMLTLLVGLTGMTFSFPIGLVLA